MTTLEKVEICLNEGRHLSKTEQRFLEDLQSQLEVGRDASPKQEAWVEQIYKEKVQ